MARQAPQTAMGQVLVALLSAVGGVGVAGLVDWLFGRDVNVQLLAVLVPLLFVIDFAAARRNARAQAGKA